MLCFFLLLLFISHLFATFITVLCTYGTEVDRCENAIGFELVSLFYCYIRAEANQNGETSKVDFACPVDTSLMICVNIST